MDQAQPSQADLISQTLAGDEDAFAALVYRHQAAVIRAAWRVLGNRQEAEDVAQETFVRAYRALSSFDRSRPLAPWLYRIATNLSLNCIKQRRATVALVNDQGAPLPLADGAPGPQVRLLQAEAQAQLQREINALPKHYCQVIKLRHFQELSYQEIADELGAPLSDVKSWLFRARKRLRQRLLAGQGE